MKLATNLSLAYDELRKQSNQLMVFAGSRIDQETGLRNRRAMEEQLGILLSIHAARFEPLLRFRFSAWEIPTNRSPNHRSARSPACSNRRHRDTDVVARYSSDEFVVLMPQTSLAGATIFSQRLLEYGRPRTRICFVFGGIVEVTSR